MQENTPAPGEINVEIKGVRIAIPHKRKRAVKLNDDMWTSCKFLEGAASPGDFLIPLEVIRLNNDNDTLAIIVKVINVNKIADNGKVNVDGKE